MNASDCAAKAVGAAFALAATALLFGCSGSASNPTAGNSCPKIVAAPGADAIVLFSPGGHERKDVMVGGKIYSAVARCTREQVGFAVSTDIEFYVERANMAIKDTTLPYFVALVDPQQRVLAEEAYQVQVPFLPGESYRRTPAEKVTIHLPVLNRAAAANYAVIVGFQLTPDQLAFNRSAHTR